MNIINRKYTFFFLILLTSFLSQSQTFEPIKNKGFDLESGTPINENIEIENKNFELFTTSKGSKYIKCLSVRTGEFYPLWMGTKTKLTHEGKSVYKSKKGKFCIYLISKKSGFPYPVWLTEQK
ncbi:hypothetical protein [Aquimarina longa]|uniref:hypothetical protein n=1 Tax=Aquimarina longa TaxID=1080221 RepID=UPI000783B8EF|nr:hypothetical protein [Aquimarina longa]